MPLCILDKVKAYPVSSIHIFFRRVMRFVKYKMLRLRICMEPNNLSVSLKWCLHAIKHICFMYVLIHHYSMQVYYSMQVPMYLSHHNSDITCASWYFKSPVTFKFIKANIMENTKVLHYWPFVRGIHQCLVVSLTKVLVYLWKLLVIMMLYLLSAVAV